MSFEEDYNNRYNKYIDNPAKANDLIQHALVHIAGICEGIGAAVSERVDSGRGVNLDFLTRLDYLVISADNLIDAYNDLTEAK